MLRLSQRTERFSPSVKHLQLSKDGQTFPPRLKEMKAFELSLKMSRFMEGRYLASQQISFWTVLGFNQREVSEKAVDANFTIFGRNLGCETGGTQGRHIIHNSSHEVPIPGIDCGRSRCLAALCIVSSDGTPLSKGKTEQIKFFNEQSAKRCILIF